MLEQKWSSRKFWAAMTWQGVFTFLLYQDKLPATSYENLTWVAIGGYFLANVGDKFARK